MVRSKLFATVSMLTLLAGASIAPIAAQADGYQNSYSQVQNQKNNWRNAAIVSAAVGIFGLATHQKSAAVAGAIGTVVAVSQEQRDQNIENNRDCNEPGFRYHQSGYIDPVIVVPNRGFDNHDGWNRDNRNDRGSAFRGGQFGDKNGQGHDSRGPQGGDRNGQDHTYNGVGNGDHNRS